MSLLLVLVVNYPRGGVGKIAEKLVTGLEQLGGEIKYQVRVTMDQYLNVSCGGYWECLSIAL
jgi:hypothetical protein